MATPKKLVIDHFLEPPMIHLKTAEQKLLYAGLRACSDCEGIVPENIDRLRLSIFATPNPRNEDLISNLSFMTKVGAIYRYKAEGEKYIILPYHFNHEGKIQYFSPTECPRPPQEFYRKYPQYNRRWKAHMEKIQKSAEGGLRPSDPPLGRAEGGRGGAEGARGSQRVPEGKRSGEMQPLSEVLTPFLKALKEHQPKLYRQYQEFRKEQYVNVKRSRNSEKTLNPGDGKHTAKGEIREKRESPKGEKGQEGEITLRQILDVCKDEQSKNFYRLVLNRCPQPMVRTALIETQCVIQEKMLRGTPGRYFTGTIKRLAAKEGINLNGKKGR